MTYCHWGFIRMEKESKECNKKDNKQIVGNNPMLANWVQIAIGITLKTIIVYH
jgi:hypothetical protein